jgi:hypothetical protein
MYFLENQYQVAYATTDIEAALAMLAREYGATAFKSLGGDDYVAANRVWTPSGEADIVMKGATCVVGGRSIEVLQPVSGAIDVFRDFATPAQPLRMHHIAMRVEDFEGVLAESERLGRRKVMEGGYRAARFAYVDARATLGHYLEYVYAPPEYWIR